MSNSPLVTYTRLSPNRNSPRNHETDTITIHCYVGQVNAERGCNGSRFTKYDPKNGASCNYVVGYDGSIGLCVDERDRSWCSSNAANDHRAVTIEVASDTTHPYAVTDAAYNALINLCADICKRNGIKKLVWSANKNDRVNRLNGCNMTVHRDFAAKACPGDYLYQRHGAIAEAVNRILDGDDDNMVYYKNLEDVPEYYQAAIKKAMEAGALNGTGDGINVSEDMCRILTVLDRMEKLG